MIPDVHGFRFLYPAAGRSLSGLRGTVTQDGVTYQLVYGSPDNTPTYLPAKQVAIQNLMRQTYQGNYAPLDFWAGVFQQVMGQPYPAAARQWVIGSYAGTPSAGADVQFTDIWQGYLRAIGQWPAMWGVVVPGEYYLAPAPVSNQAPAQLLPASAFSQQQASAVTGQPNQSVPPRDTSVPMPAGTGPTAADRLVGSYAAANAPPPSLAAPSFLSGDMGKYLLLGLGAVALFMVVKK